MSILKIYGDESGTMPVKDNDQLFVTATISTFNDKVIFERKSGHRDWLVKQIKTLNAIPFITYIKPFKGYGLLLKAKMDKLNTMARATRLITGKNKKYLTNNGIPIRNYIWTHCMIQSISQLIIKNIFTYEVKKIHIFLDEKTMSPPSRLLFIKEIKEIRQYILNTLNKIKVFNNKFVDYLENNIAFDSENIIIKWSDEIEDTNTIAGLTLAHYLASHFYKDMIKKNGPKIIQLLNKNKYDDFVFDITNIFLKSLNEETINLWKKNTGLREPKT